jgi:hypothetical protein
MPIMMAVYPWLTASYAFAIYCSGTKSFAAIPAQYVEPVKQYAAANYSLAQLQVALANGWITQQEYDDTVAYMG